MAHSKENVIDTAWTTDADGVFPVTRRKFLMGVAALGGAQVLPGLSDRNAIAQDRHRPQYHLMPPALWLNDPNGPLFWKGKYHLFYQYAPVISNSGTKYWGHAVSTDLVHWKNLGIALAPSPGGPDKNGCWTGSAVVRNGTPTIVYTGASWQEASERAAREKGLVPERQMVAVAADPDDENLLRWTKVAGNPVIAAPPAGIKVTGWRDPCVWKEADSFYMTVGSGEIGKEGMALLYRSEDLQNWTYLHPLADARPDAHPSYAMWECPDFFILDGKPVLLVARGNSYLTGSYANHFFHQEREGQIDYGNAAYAQKTMDDEQGRRIWWAWLREKRSMSAQAAAGWAGVMSLPKLLTLRADGAIGIEPVPELRALRGRVDDIAAQDIDEHTPLLLRGIAGDCLEIEAVIDPGSAKQCGLRLRCTVDGSEQTLAGYERASSTLFCDTSSSSQQSGTERGSLFPDRGIERGPLPLGSEPFRLNVFLDASVIEIFANGKASLSDRVYPSNAESLGIGLFSEGGTAHLHAMRVWRLKPISNDRLTSGTELFRV
jgi:beta-fructofuranosidase